MTEFRICKIFRFDEHDKYYLKDFNMIAVYISWHQIFPDKSPSILPYPFSLKKQFKLYEKHCFNKSCSGRAPCKFAGAMLKFYKSRSKITVKVRCSKSMALSYWKGQNIRNTCQCPISYSKKVIANNQK